MFQKGLATHSHWLPHPHLKYPCLPPQMFFMLARFFLIPLFWTKDSSYYSCNHSVCEIVATQKYAMDDKVWTRHLQGELLMLAENSDNIPYLIVGNFSCFSIKSLRPSLPQLYFCYTCPETYLGAKFKHI